MTRKISFPAAEVSLPADRRADSARVLAPFHPPSLPRCPLSAVGTRKPRGSPLRGKGEKIMADRSRARARSRRFSLALPRGGHLTELSSRLFATSVEQHAARSLILPSPPPLKSSAYIVEREVRLGYRRDDDVEMSANGSLEAFVNRRRSVSRSFLR